MDALQATCIDCGKTNLTCAFVRSPKDNNYVSRARKPIAPDDSRYVILRCTDCGSIFLHPYYHQESFAVYSQERYFTGYFPDNIHVGGGPVISSNTPESPDERNARLRVSMAKARSLLQFAGLEEKSGIRVMEIGCAQGNLLEGFAACGCETYGVDVSEQAVLEASRRGLNVTCSRFEDYDCPDEFFDLIVSIETFEHMAGLDEIARKIKRTLKPGGHLVIQVPNDIECYRRWCFSRIWWMIPPMHIRYFTRRSVRDIFAMHGLKVSAIRTTGYLLDDIRLIAGWLGRKLRIVDLNQRRTVRRLYRITRWAVTPLDIALRAMGRHMDLVVLVCK